MIYQFISVLAEDAIKAALKDYKTKREKEAVSNWDKSSYDVFSYITFRCLTAQKSGIPLLGSSFGYIF